MRDNASNIRRLQMSALYVKCPQCGPLLTFIPQGNQFSIEVKCTCGIKIAHTENCNNSKPGQDYRQQLNRYHGKHPVQQKVEPLKMNEENSEQGNCFT
jgi:hypothetical protein